jgi:uncharacterized protein RhaS with RHS repeats
MSAELGRFLQPDPIGFKGDASNLYRYCHNDAVDFTDPTGLVASDTSRFLPDRMWEMACFFDSGNSFQGSLSEFMQRLSLAGMDGGSGRAADRDSIMAGQYRNEAQAAANSSGEATIEKGRHILARQTKEGEDTTGAIVNGEPVPGDRNWKGQQVPYRFGKPVYAPSGNTVLAARKIHHIEEPVPPGRSDLLTHYHTRTGVTSKGASLAEPTDLDMRALKTTGAMLFSNPYLKAEGAYRIYRYGVPGFETRHGLYDP